MAIKGKKKSQKKGGQAKRRPAAAPRQTGPVRRPLPWYKTSAFRVSALVVLAVIAGIVIVLVQNARDDAQALEKRQESLDEYTGDIRALVQDVRPQVTAMAAVPPGEIPEDQLAKLKKDSQRWAADLTKAQADVQTVAQAKGVENVTPLYAQALQLYASAAGAYQLALNLEGPDQAQALATAAEIKGQAGALWNQATALLDEARAEAEMEPSGLTPPDPAATGGAPGQPPIPGAPGQPPIPGGGGVPPVPGAEIPPGEIPGGEIPGGEVPIPPEAPAGGGGGGGGQGKESGGGDN
jgi:hypothetical protein